MTTQYTTILKLALPVQGELSGTWGDVVNDNITQMVEQAVAGLAVIDSWTANSHTLTTADGTTSESRCAILELTDTGTALTGAGTVTCPTNTKLYIVDNNTAEIITIKTAAGTGVAVPVGKTMLVYCDGTNVVEGVTHANSLSLGTSTVTVDSVLDQDDMSSDSATALATQQSIKAYVDSQVGTVDTLAEILANGNTTGANDIEVDTTQKVQFRDTAIYINSSADGQLDIVADTEVQIAATTIDIDGAVDMASTLAVGGDVTVSAASQHIIIKGLATTSDYDAELWLGRNDTRKAIIRAEQLSANSEHDLVFFTNAASADATEKLRLGSDGAFAVKPTVGGHAVFNEDGIDADFRVESDSSTHALFVDATNGNIGINDPAPSSTLESGISATGRVLSIASGGTTAISIRAVDAANDRNAVLEMLSSGNGGSNNIIVYGDTDTTPTTKSGLVFQGYHNGSRVLRTTLDWSGYLINEIGAVFNQSGADSDFRVESDGNANMLFVDASTNRVGIGQSPTTEVLEVAGSLKLEASNAEINLKSGITGTTGSVNWTFNTDTTDFAALKLPYDSRATIGLHMDSGYPITLDYSVSSNDGLRISSSGTLEHRFNSSGATFNENSLGSLDFRVESNSNAHMLFVDAGANRVGVGTGAPSYEFVVSKDGSSGIEFGPEGIDSTTSFIQFYNRSTAAYDTARFYMKEFQLYLEAAQVIALQISTTEAVINQSGTDLDFRVESDNQSSMFAVDAGGNYITMHGAGTTDAVLNIGPNTAKKFIRMYNGIAYNAASDLDVLVYGINDTAVDNNRVYQWRHRMEADGTPASGHNYVIQSITRSGSYEDIMTFNGTAVDGGVVVHHGLAVNEDSTSVGDFRVESDSNTHMLFVDASGNFVTLGNTVSNPASGFSATGGVGYTSGGGMQIANNTSGASLVLGQNFATNGSICDFRKQSTIVGSISVTGAATAYNTSSDQRLKDNIVDAPSASDDIDAIQVRSFDWKADGSHQKYGMVAQELLEVAPSAVSQPEDPEEMMGVDYSKLVPMMLKEIQSLRARVAQLES